MTASAGATTARRPNVAKVLGVSLVGTTIEWYDWAAYMTATAIVFPTVMFGGKPGAIAGSFLIAAVGMLARPLGAIVFGHIGDTLGRKFALVGSLGLMTLCTFTVGFLPDYHTLGASAAAWLLVLRLVQSFAVGGEWGGAVLYAVESAPRNRKALYGAFPQLGNGIGFLTAELAFNAVAQQGNDFLMSYGWRIPFWVAGALGVVGLILRLRVEDSPEFAEIRALDAKLAADGKRNRVPFVELMATSWFKVLIAIGAVLITIGGYFIIITYMQARATDVLKMNAADVTLAGTIMGVAVVILIPIGAMLADKIGVVRMTLIGIALHIVFAIPMFLLAEQGTLPSLTLGMTLGQIASSFAYATIGTLVAAWFAPRVRQSGISFAYQVAGVIGGFTPYWAQALDDASNRSWLPVAFLFMAMAAVSLVCAWYGQRWSRGMDAEPVAS